MEANKNQKSSLKNSYLEAFIPHELKHSFDEAKELLNDLINKNQKMFLTNVIIIHFADDLDSLNKDGKEITAIANKFLCQVGTLHYQQTLFDFYEQLNAQDDDEAVQLATALELYVKGKLSVFSNQINININRRFVCFDIKDLGKQLKTMGMLIVLDQVWNRITVNRNRGKRTWTYLEEIYLLFANEYSANFLFELYKRARKWGGVPTGITQNVEDLLKSELARRMLSNSDFLMMLNQAPSDRNELADLLNISDTQMNSRKTPSSTR